jgi:hypothetical protein
VKRKRYTRKFPYVLKAAIDSKDHYEAFLELKVALKVLA